MILLSQMQYLFKNFTHWIYDWNLFSCTSTVFVIHLLLHKHVLSQYAASFQPWYTYWGGKWLAQGRGICIYTLSVYLYMYTLLIVIGPHCSYWIWLGIHICTVGYNDFDFFWQNGASQTGDRCTVKWDFRTHLQNIFFVFWAISFDFACKKSYLKQKKFVWNFDKTKNFQKSNLCTKNAEFGTDFESFRKSVKKFLVIKFWKNPFFSENFFRKSFFPNFSTGSKSVSNSAFFSTHIVFFFEFFLHHITNFTHF